jgi:hypothetical protein
MKDLAERVFAQLPRYLPDLAAVIGSPKRAILARSGGAPDDLQRALVFVGITVGLGFLLQAPTLPPETDFITAAAGMAAFKVIAILLFSWVVWGVFRLLGGKGEYLATLSAYLYMVSPLYLALVVLSLIGQGLLRVYDHDLAVNLRANPLYFLEHPESLARFETEAPAIALATTIVNYTSSILLMAWFILCLGAFRMLHGVSRLRSGFAGSLISLLWWPYGAVILFLALGMFGRLAPPLT